MLSTTPSPAPLGLAAAAALVAGAGACLHLPALPDGGLLAVLLPLSLLAWWPRWRLRALGPLLCGFALAGLHAGHAMALRLPASLEGRDVEVAGRVLELPRREPGRVRFRFEVEEGPGALVGRTLQLSWYPEERHRGFRRSRNAGSADVAVAPGERWRLQVKLRTPHGLRNPGTRDSERRALADRIAGSGYVRHPQTAERLSPAGGIDAWRDRMGARIAGSIASGSSRFVRALALGDTRALDTADWQV